MLGPGTSAGPSEPASPHAPTPPLVQVPEVRVDEPLPQDLVTPEEPLPRESVDLEPLPNPVAGALEGRLREDDELLETVHRWAEAWGEQQVEGYLDFYATRFETPGSMPRSAWEELRRRRLLAPAFIEVVIEEPKVQRISESAGLVEFIQRYQSDRYRDTVRKILQLTREGERWKILSEQSEELSGT